MAVLMAVLKLNAHKMMSRLIWDSVQCEQLSTRVDTKDLLFIRKFMRDFIDIVQGDVKKRKPMIKANDVLNDVLNEVETGRNPTLRARLIDSFIKEGLEEVSRALELTAKVVRRGCADDFLIVELLADVIDVLVKDMSGLALNKLSYILTNLSSVHGQMDLMVEASKGDTRERYIRLLDRIKVQNKVTDQAYDQAFNK